MKAIYQALLDPAAPGVLATVVRVEGSAYRREGAKLWIGPDGSAAGMLSGGCLEEDVKAQAVPTLETGAARLLEYDMRADEDNLWGLNMGCNGKVEVLVERPGPALAAVASEYLAGRTCTALAVMAPGLLLGRRLVIRADGSSVGSLGDPGADREAGAAVAGPALGPRVLSLAGLVVFAEPVAPPPVLWVVGGGPDAPALVRAAALAGWRVRVVDRRPAYADPARFPEADLVRRMEPEELAAALEPGAYALVMHHHFDHDREFLQAILTAAPRYVGVLGPLRRTVQLLGSAVLPPAVYAPVGLDLGGDGPEAVAVSVVAELQAVRHGRAGGHLRGAARPIHPGPQLAQAEEG